MWMHPKFQDVVRPLVTSHYYKMEPFQKDYFYQATLDNTNYNVTKVAVQFYKDIGGIVSFAKVIRTKQVLVALQDGMSSI